MADTLPTPITRQEQYLAVAAGVTGITLPTPITREEKYLAQIAENGSGGGGTSPFYPAGNIAFASLPNPSAETLGAMYNITDAFTTDSRFNEGSGVKYPAGTNVAVVNTGTEQSPVYKFDTYAGAYTVDDVFSATSENPVQNKVVKAALDSKVDEVEGKGLSTNDYTNADKTKVSNSPISSTASGTSFALTDAADAPLAGLVIEGRTTSSGGVITNVGDNGLSVTACGKNLFGFGVNAVDKTEEYRTLPAQRLIVVNSDTNNIEFRYNDGPWSTAYIELPIDGTKEYSISYDVNATQYNPNIAVDTTLSDANRLMLVVNGNNRGTSAPTTLSFTISNIQIEVGSTATAYEPYKGSTAVLSTGLPLCSFGDVKDTADFGKGIVTKRTKIENGEVVALDTPTELSMTASELATFHELRTFENTTNITCTDSPQMTLDYLIDTENGASIGQVTENMTGFINSLAFVWNTPEMHRMIFRGKYLGDHVTTAQLAAIRDGLFDDLYIGDYWVMGGVTWRIADVDYWLGCGDTALYGHHLIIVPDSCLYNAKMNDTNTTTGGYVGSKMYTENLTRAKTTINSLFVDMVLTHRERLVNAVSNGKASGDAWYDSTVELMNENMVYGHREFTPGGDGTTVPVNYTINKTQLALFALAPTFITNRANQWLRDVVSAASFATVSSGGLTDANAAPYTLGVRPVFAIG